MASLEGSIANAMLLWLNIASELASARMSIMLNVVILLGVCFSSVVDSVS